MKVENRQQFLIILTAISAALLIGNSLVWEPLANLWAKRSAEIASLREQVKEGNGLIRSETVIRSEWRAMQANALPNNTSQAASQMINALDNWASASGAVVSTIAPQWQDEATNYMTLNCRVEASGNMGALSQFLYEIERGPMALKLDSVELLSRDDAGQNLNLNLQISGLALKMPSKP